MVKPRGPLTLLARSRKARLTVAVILVLPVLYMLSFGPACWMTAVPLNGGSSDCGNDASLIVSNSEVAGPPKALRAYWPLGWAATNGSIPAAIRGVLWWWV